MPFSTVVYTKLEHVAYITLNRPETGNLIDEQMAGELQDVCQQINEDDAVYVTVITGAGETFCRGSQLDPGKYSLAKAVADIWCPVIAAINGDAVGQGLELVLSCDIRLAGENACFALPHVAQGLIPLDGGTQRLPRIVGKSKALELLLTAETITAREACQIGLVNRVIQDDLMSDARTLAKIMSGKGPLALRFLKEAVNKGLDLTLEQGMRLEADLYFLIHTTADRTEGIKAFLEKRPPQFKGQ